MNRSSETFPEIIQQIDQRDLDGLFIEETEWCIDRKAVGVPRVHSNPQCTRRPARQIGQPGTLSNVDALRDLLDDGYSACGCIALTASFGGWLLLASVARTCGDMRRRIPHAGLEAIVTDLAACEPLLRNSSSDPAATSARAAAIAESTIQALLAEARTHTSPSGTIDRLVVTVFDWSQSHALAAAYAPHVSLSFRYALYGIDSSQLDALTLEGIGSDSIAYDRPATPRILDMAAHLLEDGLDLDEAMQAAELLV